MFRRSYHIMDSGEIIYMAKEYLTEEEFKHWCDNCFAHLRDDVTTIKANVAWLKWLVCGISLAVLVKLVLEYFGI